MDRDPFLQFVRGGIVQHVEEIVGDQRDNRLRLRIPEPHVELEHFRAFGSQHETRIQQSFEGSPFHLHSLEGGFDDRFENQGYLCVFQTGHGSISAHSSRVGTPVAVMNPLVILRRWQHQCFFATTNCVYRGLLAFQT